MGGDVFRHAKVEDVEGFLFEGFVVGLVDERAVEFFGDFLLEALFDNRAWRFAGAEAGDAGLAGVTSDDLFALALDFVRWNFNAQGGDALWQLFDNNVHDKLNRLWRRDGQPRGKRRYLSNEACIL